MDQDDLERLFKEAQDEIDAMSESQKKELEIIKRPIDFYFDNCLPARAAKKTNRCAGLYNDRKIAKKLSEAETDRIRNLNLEYEDLLGLAVKSSLAAEFYQYQYERTFQLMTDAMITISAFGNPRIMGLTDPKEVLPLFHKLSEHKNKFADQMLEGVGLMKSIQAADAVSHRTDQQLKPLWEAHCKKAVESGAKILQLNDLFQIEGCNPSFKKSVDTRTLKRWASESAGIEFKPGRPKK